MSHADDANVLTSVRDWMIASLVLVVPLVWVGTQALDEPLYRVGVSRPAHAVAVAQAPVRHHVVKDGFHAPLLSDTRVLFALEAIDARTGYEAPWLSGVRAKASHDKGQRANAIALDNANTQAYQLAVAEPR